MNMGYVYILTNKSYRYGWLRRKLLKIGQTSKNPEDRAKELSSTGVPTPFEVVYYLQSDQYEEIEKEMHRRLGVFRSNKDREFFKYPVKKAIKLLDKLGKEYAPVQLPRIIEEEPVKPGLGINKLLVEPIKVSGNDYPVKLGMNGKPYYSSDNGFHEAVNARGMPAAIRSHVTIIIDNEELEIRASHEHLESQIDKLYSDVEQLEIDKEEVEKTVVAKQENIAEKQQALSELKAIDDLELTIREKIEESNSQQVKLVELEAELKKFPPDDGTSKHRQLRLYPVFGIFCVILSLALYFFYVSALDKGFFSSIDLENTDMTSYASLNELFDSTAFFRAIRKVNLWLLLFPIFPLGLALVIHPFWTSAIKQWESGKKFFTFLCVFIALLFVGLTLIFDSILALQISKKIHEAKVIMGLTTGEWTINPIAPLTWDLNIVLVLFCGFFVSVLLSVLFHFTLEMWKEARTQSADDRNSIVKEKTRLEVEIKNSEDEIARLSENLERSIQEMEGYPDTVLIKSQITGLDNDIRNLENQVESDKKRVGSIQSDIVQMKNSISELQERKNKRLIDLVKLRAQIDEFLVGWNRFLVVLFPENNDADEAIEKAREIAYEIFDKHFQSGGTRWESK